MSRAFLIKYILLLTVCVLISKLAFGQKELKIRGQLLVDRKLVVDAEVIVYEGSKIVNKTTTNDLGKFTLNVEYDKIYVILFKNNTIPTQKVALYTKSKNKKIHNGVLLFTLSSKKSSKEGTSMADVVASFKIRESGKFQQETVYKTIEPIRNVATKEDIIDTEIKNIEDKAERKITQIPKKNRTEQISDYKIIQRKKDSILMLAEKKAALMIINAQEQSTEIQNLEIRHKNTVLILVVVVLVTLVILFFVLYQNFKTKNKSNQILAKKNAEIAKKNKKILDSIRYAQTIQQAVLPMKATIDKYFNWLLVFKPKDIVSGDFYWFNHFDKTGKSVFAVVDCTGHGVPGAFMSMIGNRLLTEAVIENEITNPVEILEVIDKGIRFALMQDHTSNNDGMDICVCTIDRVDDNKRKVHFAGAKRPLFYTDTKANEINFIKGTIRGIGGKKRLREKPKKPFEEHSLMLEKGDKLYMTTDGLFDLQSPNWKKFGRIKFMNLLKENYKKPLNEQYDGIIKAMKEHRQSEPQIDDITVIGIEL